jgi:Co/Zn/Cd efflux system component
VHGARWPDAVSAVVIALLTFRAAAPIFQKTSRILAQAVPAGLNPDAAVREIASAHGVLECTSWHFWALAPGHNVGTIALRTRADADHERIIAGAHRVLAPPLVHNLAVQCVRERQAKWLQPAQHDGDDAAGTADERRMPLVRPAPALGADKDLADIL